MVADTAAVVAGVVAVAVGTVVAVAVVLAVAAVVGVVAVALEIDTVAVSPASQWAVVVFDRACRVVRGVGCPVVVWGAGCPVVVRRRRKSFPRNCRNRCRMLRYPRFDSRSFYKVSLMSLQS